jgi:hypothetical protein
LAERDVEQSKDTECRQQRNKWRKPRNIVWLVFVGGIYEHEACDVVRVIGREDTDVETAARCPDEHQWSINSAAAEEFEEFAGDAASCPRRRTSIAVSHPSAVIGADTRESGNIGLDEAPVRARTAKARIKDGNRRAIAGAPEMQPVPSHIDEVARRWRRRQVSSRRNRLVRSARERSQNDQAAETAENPYRPTGHVGTSRAEQGVPGPAVPGIVHRECKSNEHT